MKITSYIFSYCIIFFVLAIFAFIQCLVNGFEHYDYRYSTKIMELSNLDSLTFNKSKCYTFGPEKVNGSEKYLYVEGNYNIVEFVSNCDLGDTVGFYEKKYFICEEMSFGCYKTYYYRAKIHKDSITLSLFDLIK